MTLYYPPTKNALQKTLDAQLDQGFTSSMTLNNTTGVQNKPGIALIDRIDSNNNVKSASKWEWVIFTGTSGNTLTGLTRGVAGSSDQDHAVGAIVEFVSDITGFQAILDTFTTNHNTDGTHTNALVTTLKASGSDITTGTSDTTIVTPKAIKDAADGLITLTDVTTNDVSTSKHGFVPKAPNDSTKFLRGDATWAVPATNGAWTDYSSSVTIVGFSSFSTKVITYITDGKICHMAMIIGGTSNATNFTISLPVAVVTRTGLTLNFPARVADNGSYAIGFAEVASGGSTLTMYKDGAGNTWTSSGTKSAIFTITYETA